MEPNELRDEFRTLHLKLDDLYGILFAIQRRVSAIEAPDETWGVDTSMSYSGLTANQLKELIRSGALTDARPEGHRKCGTPLRWFSSELAAYRRGGAEAVRLVRKARGRD